jgi:hypothetical protein
MGWLAGASVLSLVVIGLVGGPGPLDDPQQGDQRAGFLVDVEEARMVRGLGLPGRPVGRRPVFLAFARDALSGRSVRDALGRLPEAFAAFLVLPSTSAPGAAVPTVSDSDGGIAHAVGIGRPKDGGPPIGYAVLDRRGRVRYATIDPGWPRHGDEIELITEAVR